MHLSSPIVVTIIIILIFHYKGSFTDRCADFIKDLLDKASRKKLLIKMFQYLFGYYLIQLMEHLFEVKISDSNWMTFFLLAYFMMIIHELGHYLAAKFYRVPIHAFIIGNGPTLIKTKKVLFRLLPFTGYVKFGYLKKPTHGIIVLLSGVGLQLVTLPLILFVMKAWSFSSTMMSSYSVLTVAMVIFNLLPLSSGCDGNMILKLMKKDPQVIQQFIG